MQRALIVFKIALCFAKINVIDIVYGYLLYTRLYTCIDRNFLRWLRKGRADTSSYREGDVCLCAK